MSMPWSTVFIGIWFAVADLANALVAEFDGTAMLLSEFQSQIYPFALLAQLHIPELVQ